MDPVAKNRGAPYKSGNAFLEGVCSVEDIVPQDQCHRIAPDEILRNQKCLRDPLRLRLLPILHRNPHPRSVAKQLPEQGQVIRGGNQAELADPALDQSGQRVIDHRLVVDGLQLLARHQRQGKQTRPRAAGQNDALHAVPLPDLPCHSRNTAFVCDPPAIRSSACSVGAFS